MVDAGSGRAGASGSDGGGSGAVGCVGVVVEAARVRGSISSDGRMSHVGTDQMRRRIQGNAAFGRA